MHALQTQLTPKEYCWHSPVGLNWNRLGKLQKLHRNAKKKKKNTLVCKQISSHTNLIHTGLHRGTLLRGVKERELSEATPECYSLYWFPIIRPPVPVESLVPGSNRQTEKETNTSHLHQHGGDHLTSLRLGRPERSRGGEETSKRGGGGRGGDSGRTSAMGQQMETAEEEV